MRMVSVSYTHLFQDGLPDKKAYRIYRIKTVEGANDFASMAEVITRRFTHGLKERHEREQAGLDPDAGSFSKMPDVILIDGGPEQLLRSAVDEDHIRHLGKAARIRVQSRLLAFVALLESVGEAAGDDLRHGGKVVGALDGFDAVDAVGLLVGQAVLKQMCIRDRHHPHRGAAVPTAVL